MYFFFKSHDLHNCIIAHMYICRINALEELLEQQKVSTDEKVAEESRKYSAALVRNI